MTDIPSQAFEFNADPTTGAGHAVKSLVAQAQQVVRLARALAVADRTVDLEGLEHLIGVSCAQALDLPPSEGRALRVLLEALLAECDALDSTLRHPARPRQKAASCPLYPLPS